MWKGKIIRFSGILFLLALSILFTFRPAWADSNSINKQFTTDFDLAGCTFSDSGANAFFSLDDVPAPGSDWVNPILLEGEEDKELVQVEITVLDEFEPIDLSIFGLGTVVTRVIQEREWVDGELVEVSRNYFARCMETNGIYYFGEDVDIYDEEGNITHEGAWIAGELSEDGETYNQPGLIMPGEFLLGARYYQEIAPEVALDRAENIEMGLDVETPAGIFSNSVKIVETTPLEPSSKDMKIYAHGIGLIVDSTIERVDTFTEP